jgi:hypothetical protein
MKNDFYAVFNEFFEGRSSIKPVNRAFITLIPKKASPEFVNDYRPISLVNISPKLVS